MEQRLCVIELDSSRQVVPPKDAATVIIVRDGSQGLEVFCVRRHAKSAFMGGALVFPGGKLDPNDLDPRWGSLSSAFDPRTTVFADNPAHALGLCVAACRETLEEGFILPTLPSTDDRLLAELVEEAKSDTFLNVLTKRNLRLDLARLAPFARWVTPEAESRRFDARFFLLSLPDGQVGRHDDHETTMSLWAKPQDILNDGAEGRFFLAPPTARTLELLADLSDVRSAFALAEKQTLLPVCPEFVAQDPPFLALPGDPTHSIREKRVDGPSRYVLREGRFVSEDAPGHGE